MNPKPLESLNHFTVPVSMMSYLLLMKLKRRKRTKKMPQSQSVFAVSLQEHPELLRRIMPLLRRNVNGYYCSDDNNLPALRYKKIVITIDGLVKSLLGRHCEERSDAAISIFQKVAKDEIASLRSQGRRLGLFTISSP